MVIRTWNVFHGNAVPPERCGHLEQAIRLVVSEEPDIVCLQEVPLWAFGLLEEWSGMRTYFAAAAPASIGPLPSTPVIGYRLSRFHAGLLRSAFSGQGNAILAVRALTPLDEDVCVLNSRRFRSAQARWLDLDFVTRLAWAVERRVCLAVRFSRPDGKSLLVANLHATAASDRRLADAELFRAATFADGVAAPDDVCVLAGDLNVAAVHSRTLAMLASDEWGFSPAGEGIDHILVRGATTTEAVRWPEERRRLDGRLLSDHAPVEVELEL